jgi:pimeloyl-ACP methyl ester carboxylesterase
MAGITRTQVDTRLGSIELRRGGSGQPVVYLHSAMGEAEVAVPFLAALAERVEVFAPMFCGFENSEGIEQIDDMEDAVYHLLDLFDRLGLDAPTVSGLSLGGWMAAELASRYPERVGRLVLVNPAGLYLPGAEIRDIFGRSPSEMADDLFADHDHPIAQMMRTMETNFAELTAGMEIPFELVKPQYQAMAATARLGWDPYLHNPKLRKRLHRITAPTLVIRGRHDTLIPAPHCETYAAEIPGATLYEMTEVSHMIPLEAPAELAELIAGWATEGRVVTGAGAVSS